MAAGCGLVSTQTQIERPPALTASRQELIDKIQRLASVQSMKAAVYIQLTVESDARDTQREYTEVRGAIVTRRPGWIRTTAQYPGGIKKAFDMVSNGETFQVHIPLKNTVYEGRNELGEPSDKRSENIRPQHIGDALMFEAIAENDVILMNAETYGRAGYQVLHLARRDKDGELQVHRNYWFSRDDLSLSRLMILDENSELETDAWYREWGEDAGLPYPTHAEIRRPLDGYEIDIEVLKPGLDEPVPDTSFVLDLPGDVQVEQIGNTPDTELTTSASND